MSGSQFPDRVTGRPLGASSTTGQPQAQLGVSQASVLRRGQTPSTPPAHGQPSVQLPPLQLLGDAPRQVALLPSIGSLLAAEGPSQTAAEVALAPPLPQPTALPFDASEPAGIYPAPGPSHLPMLSPLLPPEIHHIEAGSESSSGSVPNTHWRPRQTKYTLELNALESLFNQRMAAASARHADIDNSYKRKLDKYKNNPTQDPEKLKKRQDKTEKLHKQRRVAGRTIRRIQKEIDAHHAQPQSGANQP
jgi:hypothetical protein